MDPIADHILEHGLDGSNLRALAKAANTSDRMLLYYFTDKDDLVTVALAHLADRLARKLAEKADAGRCEPPQLVAEVWTAVQDPELWPYVVLFVDVVAHASRVGEPYICAALHIAEQFEAWLADRLEETEGQDRQRQARDVLAIIDGRILLRMAGLDIVEPGRDRGIGRVMVPGR